MYYNTLAIEQGHRNRGLKWSVFFHVMIVLISWWYSFSAEVKDPDPEKPYKVKVQFVELKESSLSTYAHADAGAQRPKTEEIELLAPKLQAQVIQEIVKEEIKEPKPIMTTTAPVTPPKTAEVVVDESPVEIVQSEVEVEQPKVEQVPVRPAPPAPTPPSPPVESKPVATNTSPTGGTGTNTKPASTGDGSGSGKADAGTGAGSTSGKDATSGVGKRSDGNGAYDGSGRSIFGRKAVDKNFRGFPILKSSEVAIKVCINPAGAVTFASIIEAETKETDRAVLKKFLSGAWGMKFEPDPTAPTEECGKVVWQTKNATIPLR